MLSRANLNEPNSNRNYSFLRRMFHQVQDPKSWDLGKCVCQRYKRKRLFFQYIIEILFASRYKLRGGRCVLLSMKISAMMIYREVACVVGLDKNSHVRKSIMARLFTRLVASTGTRRHQGTAAACARRATSPRE